MPVLDSRGLCMLTKLLSRLFVRAAFTLGLMLALASFALYLGGGNPGALWSRIGGGAAERVVAAVGNARHSVSALVGDTVRRTQASGFDTEGSDVTISGDSRSTRVWSWRDADGVMHFASTAPAGVDAAAVSVNPDVNVLPAVRARDIEVPPRSVPKATSSGSLSAGGRATSSRRDPVDELVDGEPLPGIAGMLQRSRESDDAHDSERAEALLKLLQSGQR